MAEEHEQKAREAFNIAKNFVSEAKWVKYFTDPHEGNAEWISDIIAEARRYNQCGVYHRRKAKELANV